MTATVKLCTAHACNKLHTVLTTQTVEDRAAALQTTIFNETSSPVCSEVMLPAIDIFHKSFLNLYGICLRKMNKIGLGVSEINV